MIKRDEYVEVIKDESEVIVKVGGRLVITLYNVKKEKASNPNKIYLVGNEGLVATVFNVVS